MSAFLSCCLMDSVLWIALAVQTRWLADWAETANCNYVAYPRCRSRGLAYSVARSQTNPVEATCLVEDVIHAAHVVIRRPEAAIHDGHAQVALEGSGVVSRDWSAPAVAAGPLLVRGTQPGSDPRRPVRPSSVARTPAWNRDVAPRLRMMTAT